MKLVHISRSATLASALLISAAAMAQQAAPAVSLKVGDSAPTLKVDSWAQGTPVKAFEKGKVYVVEFWATWCGPCIQSMPHLSEMSKKFKGKATFTGVDVWEDRGGEYTAPTKVKKFLADNPGRIAYNVALDGKDGWMSNNWLRAAGQNGIPAAFVVDQSGKIAWIGHPMDGLEDVLAKVVDKKFDGVAFAAEKEKKEAAREAALKPINDAMKAKDYKAVLTAVDGVEKSNPDLKEEVMAPKFIATVHTDLAAATALVEKAKSDKNDDILAFYGSVLVGEEGLAPEAYTLGISIFEAKITPTSKPNQLVSTYYYIAQGYSLAKQPAKAVEAAQKSYDNAKTANLGESTLKFIQTAIDKYKKEAGQ